jgi:small-conductance mechanosensitive channel
MYSNLSLLHILSISLSDDFLRIPLMIILDILVTVILLIVIRFLFKKFMNKLINFDFSKISKKLGIRKYMEKKDIAKTQVLKKIGFSDFAKRRTKRLETLGTLLLSIITVCIFILLIIVIITQFNAQDRISIGILGFIGVALGLGTQTIAKDVALGLLSISEDQFGVGDKVEINGITGEVVNVSPRLVTLKEQKNKKVWYIPYSTITSVANMSKGDL